VEDCNILKACATALKRRVPLLGGVLVAWLTVLAWVLPFLASEFALFTGESSAMFMILFPLWWSGLLTGSWIMQICKLDPTQYESLGRLLSAICSTLINGAVAWALLALILKIARSFKRRKSL
jgi:hypothetical protein